MTLFKNLKLFLAGRERQTPLRRWRPAWDPPIAMGTGASVLTDGSALRKRDRTFKQRWKNELRNGLPWGKKNGFTEIELFNPESGNWSIRRNFSADGKTSWELNGDSARVSCRAAHCVLVFR